MIDPAIAPTVNPAITDRDTALVLSLGDVGMKDLALVGGKNASLGEMLRQLTHKGVSVPGGFATTAHAYRYFLANAGLDRQLAEIFANLDIQDINQLQECGKRARKLILDTPFPAELEHAIAVAYGQMCAEYGADTDVAVRSSATAEDLPDASFAGQQESFLNISGTAEVIATCHRCFASLFTDRAISYRQKHGFGQLDVALSVGVQQMVRSDLATSGVMFSIDPETGFREAILVTAAYGLGENIVQGNVNPDEYVVFKPTLHENANQPIINRRLGSKEKKLIYGENGQGRTHNVEVDARDRDRFALADAEVVQLARWALIIEDHYSEVHNVYTPMDIEWAKDGITGKLYIVQARPETVQSQKSQQVVKNYQLTQTGEILVTGRSIGTSIGQGTTRVILDLADLEQFQAGEVLVTARTDPDWEPIMQKASAIVTNQGGRTCHAAIVARELGIPAVVGCNTATSILPSGQPVTVSCAEGETGNIYAGLLPFTVNEVTLDNLPQPPVSILLNVGNPELAFGLASTPNQGVGLARMEFIIANQIKIHPLALLNFDELGDANVKAQIADLTKSYPTKSEFFIDRLACGIGTIAAAFYPKPVIVRLSDFKSNEYAFLLGGKQFEPDEENPMIGWRGASRYYDERYRAGFALECQAMKRVRDDMGLTNVILMVPFCRTPEEGKKVVAEMAANGLVRGENGLQVYVMCELPSNVILADEFCQIFDGFSIGSNDLTQLTLGLDRDSARIAHLFDERHPAIKSMISLAIQTCKRNGRKIGICGQAPSDYPEFAQFLIEQGIDSISLNPDSVLSTLLAISEW
jgi:pyruvate,water dikinase